MSARLISYQEIARRKAQPARASHPIPSSLAAPIGGWNSRDALANMDPLDAVFLTNMWPTQTYVALRDGYSHHVTGLPSQVESLMVYSSATANKMFAASGTAFYNVTSAGAVGAAVVTGLTNARWQSVNITTSGGSYMYTVNGADKPELYDGTNWVAVDGVSVPAITGVTTTTLVHVNLFKNRLWFVQKDTLKAWYLPTNAVGGAATSFDLSGIARRGGYLMGMGTWTIDAGDGVDDLAVFITSNGEIIVYRGTDPSSAATWALVGVWQLGSPIGRRCFLKYQGDLLLITYDGVLPLSAALQSSRVNPRVALSDKIAPSVTEVTSVYGGNFGWQLQYFPKANMLILNVPISQGSQQQYVMNTVTKAWANFTSWQANCWEILNDNLYFGADTFVNRAWDGSFSDNNQSITAEGKQAFNYFKSPGIVKRWTLAQPVLATGGQPGALFNINVDFDDTAPSSVLTYTPASSGVWDSAIWDGGNWISNLAISQAWQGVNGVGKCAAGRLKIVASGIQVQWMATNYIHEKGGLL